MGKIIKIKDLHCSECGKLGVIYKAYIDKSMAIDNHFCSLRCYNKFKKDHQTPS